MSAVTNHTLGRLASLVSAGVDGWVVDLMTELDRQRMLPGRQVSSMFARIADTCEIDRDDRDEMRAFKAALRRLETEQPDEHQAVGALLRPAVLATDVRQAGIAGLNRVGQWVDEAMGDQE